MPEQITLLLNIGNGVFFWNLEREKAWMKNRANFLWRAYLFSNFLPFPLDNDTLGV